LNGIFGHRQVLTYLCTCLHFLHMKSLVKLLMLLALVVGGKLAKEAAPTTVAQAPAPVAEKEKSSRVVMVHQVLTSEPVPPAAEQPRQGSPIVTEMF
jgi:hypothetical protein